MIIDKLSLIKNNKPVLNEISFMSSPGTIVALVGRSGAGKTTVLRCLAGLEKKHSGSITIDGLGIDSLLPAMRAKKIGFVAQNYNLFPHKTVLENCTLALTVGQINTDTSAKPLEILKKLGLGEYKDAYPNQLSGGQKQRVAIARALCLRPEVLLFDEPSSALDPENRNILAKIILELKAENFTIILSSQDMVLVEQVADSVIYLENGKQISEKTSPKDFMYISLSKNNI